MRLYTLDYLRGLAAFGIMFYHLTQWTYGPHDPNSFMGKVGYYGVSIFYVLSGLTLYHVYYKKMRIENLHKFFIKRFFRIFPLMWIVMLLTIWIGERHYSLPLIAANLTGLFGFIKPSAYIGTGMWSIGNELVFYVFFPAFVLFYKKDHSSIWIFGLALLVAYLYFAFFNDYSWESYVNPLNQVFLFYCGFMIGLKAPAVKHSWIFIVAGVALFLLWPVSSVADLVTGWGRLVFTLCCLLVTYGFYRMQFKFIWPLSKLGEISYSVYLIHPLVYFGVGKLNLSPLPTVIICIVATLIASYFVYMTVEKFFINLARGKKKIPGQEYPGLSGQLTANSKRNS